MKTHGMGSLNNVMAANTLSAAPVVGMGATELLYSDRNPYTVVKVLTRKKIVVTADAVTWKPFPNGYADTMTPDPDGTPVTLTLRKDGRWKRAGGSTIFHVGSRSGYRDPSF